jgi:hypothetical protein
MTFIIRKKLTFQYRYYFFVPSKFLDNIRLLCIAGLVRADVSYFSRCNEIFVTLEQCTYAVSNCIFLEIRLYFFLSRTKWEAVLWQSRLYVSVTQV